MIGLLIPNSRPRDLKAKLKGRRRENISKISALDQNNLTGVHLFLVFIFLVKHCHVIRSIENALLSCKNNHQSLYNTMQENSNQNRIQDDFNRKSR